VVLPRRRLALKPSSPFRRQSDPVAQRPSRPHRPARASSPGAQGCADRVSSPVQLVCLVQEGAHVARADSRCQHCIAFSD